MSGTDDVYVASDRDATTGKGCVVFAQIIVDVKVSVRPARVLARQVQPPMPTLVEESPLVGEPGNSNVLTKNGRKCCAHPNSTFFSNNLKDKRQTEQTKNAFNTL